MKSLFAVLSRALALSLVLMAAAVAQPAAPGPAAPSPFAAQSQKLDGVRANLDQIGRTLARKDLSDAELQDLRARLDPLAQSAQSVIDDMQPRSDAIKARIDQLGPKPAANAPPESPEVATQRDEQQKLFDVVDGVVKRAGLYAKEIEQDADSITAQRRELFTRALFARTPSIIDPRLWISVAAEGKRDGRAARTVAGDWLDSARGKLAGWNGAVMLAALVALGAAYVLLRKVSGRVNLRDPAVHDPSALRKSTAATWALLVDIATPIAAAIVLFGIARSFDLIGARMEPLANALFDAVARIAAAAAAARALLAPGLVNWRPLDLTDATVERLCKVVIIVAAIVSGVKISEACLEIIGAGLRSSIALRGAGALLSAALAGVALHRVAATSEREEECLPPRVAGGPDWRGPLRASVWVIVATVIGATLIGFNAFAAFLVDQTLWVAFVGACLFLLINLADEAITVGLQPGAPVGRAAINTIGLRRESLDQIAVLLTGALTVGLASMAIMLVLAPWGVESDDMFGGVRTAFFGFRVGEVTISLSSIIVAFILFGLVWALARALQNWLETRFLPHTQLDAGLRNSIRTSIGYIGFLLALSVALGYLGLSFDKLAIVAGALSVGIGFGLQSIVNNFVSGLILLWERAIRVGDWVVIGDEQGYVRRINVRSTEIETFDRAMMIVPNSNLVSGVVKNWVRNDRVGRIKNPVSLTTDADPEKAREILLACAASHDLVQKFPAPGVLFTGMTDNALKFELVCFVSDVEVSARIRSDLNFEILKRLRAEGIAVFSAPTNIALVDVERIEAALSRAMKSDRTP